MVISALFLGMAFVSLEALQGSYTTSFTQTENPISEGSRWINGKTVGLDWSNVAVSSGVAYGTQRGIDGYNDSLAVLSGTWGPDQTAEATVHSINQVGGNTFQEVELLLRFAISAHSARGYEINFRAVNTSEAYSQIVRWNGSLGNFTLIDSRGGTAYGIKEGDVVKATIVGNKITTYINGVAKFSVTDSTFSNGAPGMGFYLQGSGVTSNYGFTKFTASDGGSNNVPAPPSNLRIISLSLLGLWHTDASNFSASPMRQTMRLFESR